MRRPALGFRPVSVWAGPSHQVHPIRSISSGPSHQVHLIRSIPSGPSHDVRQCRTTRGRGARRADRRRFAARNGRPSSPAAARGERSEPAGAQHTWWRPTTSRCARPGAPRWPRWPRWARWPIRSWSAILYRPTAKPTMLELRSRHSTWTVMVVRMDLPEPARQREWPRAVQPACAGAPTRGYPKGGAIHH